MKHTIEIDIECKSCSGTGVYQGMAEQAGAAVVCCTCKGTGKEHYKFSYTEFTKRKQAKDVKRVFQHNPGFVISSDPKFGGMPYKNWENGESFPDGSELRQLVCPAWWYQGIDWKKKPNWPHCVSLGQSFSQCQHFPYKDQCWERYDKEKK